MRSPRQSLLLQVTQLSYDALLLATGGKPRQLDVPWSGFAEHLYPA